MRLDKQKASSKGFTLIELLVVIAIISILSVIGMTQLARAREKARDSQRRLDLSQIQHTLTSFYDDFNQRYPLVEDTTQATIIPDHSKRDTSLPNPDATGIFKTGGPFIPAYMQQEVQDPLKGMSGHEYFYTANCDTPDCVSATGATDYVLYTRLEVGGFVYAMNPTGKIADVADQFTNLPTCKGAASAAAIDPCTLPN